MSHRGTAQVALAALGLGVAVAAHGHGIMPGARGVDATLREAPAGIETLQVDSRRFVSAQDFRTLHPPPPMLRDVLDRYAAADARLRERAADGAGARFAMTTVDGRAVVGEDRYRFEPPGWLEERRDDRHALAVGQRACTREAGTSDWSCEDTEIEYGLPVVDADAVWQATSAAIDCGGRRCVRLVLAVARTFGLGETGPQGSFVAEPPWDDGRRLVLDLDAGSGDPRRLQMIDVLGPGRIANAVYDYDLDLVVAPFELPRPSAVAPR